MCANIYSVWCGQNCKLWKHSKTVERIGVGVNIGVAVGGVMWVGRGWGEECEWFWNDGNILMASLAHMDEGDKDGMLADP